MQVNLKVFGRDLPPSLKMLIQQHFRFAVYPHRSTVDYVDVVLSTDNDDPSGSRVHCRAQVHLRNGRSLTIERQDNRVETTVNRVAKRVFHSLRCRNERRRTDEPQCTA